MKAEKGKKRIIARKKKGIHKGSIVQNAELLVLTLEVNIITTRP